MSDPSRTTQVLLVTDIVDSTQLTARLGDDAMAGLWTLHDRCARDLLAAWRGREIDKTDGMLVLFQSAADAAGYSAAYHAALARLPSAPKARAGMHLAEVILRENDASDVARGAKPLEVDGLAKSVAARVMALANPGQTLATTAAARALEDTGLPARSLGHWWLKGVPEPLELFGVQQGECCGAHPVDGDKAYQVAREGTRWVPTSDLPNNLPATRPVLFGRGRELDALRELCRSSRLVTLTGMGGMGKTQLALQAAREARAGYPDGTWFVDLQAIRDPDHVITELSQVLDLRAEAGKPLLRTVCGWLRSRAALLVLDNCEQVIEACAETAQSFLDAAAQVHIIATSREPLGLTEETVFPVSSLPVPASAGDPASESPAVQLFVERAARHGAAPLRAAWYTEVSELVQRLEGIPLAIELAAARARAMSIPELNRHLERHRYELLTQGGRARAPRQRTLGAMLDWSYELLSLPEQRAFESLAVFAGGCDLPAAQAVLSHADTREEDVPELLLSLVGKSLLTFESEAGVGRYRMLETVREYAATKLDTSARALRTRQAHCNYFFEFAKAAKRGMESAAGSTQPIERELDNIRAAMALALTAPSQPMLAVKIGVAMQGFWMLRGHAREGLAYMKAAMELPAVKASEMARAHALYVCASLAGSQGQIDESLALLEESLSLRRQLGGVADIAASLSTQAYFRIQIGDIAGAVEREREALELFTSAGDRFGQCVSLAHLAQASLFAGSSMEARPHADRCLALAREIQNPELEAEAELMLGQIQIQDRSAAATHFERAFSICEESGNTLLLASTCRWQGRLAALCADTANALALLVRAAGIVGRFGVPDELLLCIEDAAALLPADTGAWLAGAASSARQRLRLARSADDQRRWDALIHRLEAQLAGERFQLAWADGAEGSLEQAVQLIARACDAAPQSPNNLSPN